LGRVPAGQHEQRRQWQEGSEGTCGPAGSEVLEWRHDAEQVATSAEKFKEALTIGQFV
jgi:hypothetical protein